MGVTLDLRMIDHHHVVEDGVVAINEAISRSEASILVDYILEIPFTPDPEAIAYRQARCERLREVKAPDVIIQNEERLMRLVTGEAYSRDELSKQSLDELRQLLGTWRWAEYSFSIDKLWSELDWFLQPAEGPDDFPMYPLRPKVGDEEQTLLDQVLKGSQQSPLDNSDIPIITPCGSDEEDCFGYNPPSTVAEIVPALTAINPNAWADLVPQRIAMYKKTTLDVADSSIQGIVDRELEFARDAFPVCLKAYNTAMEHGFGIACEYSL